MSNSFCFTQFHRSNIKLATKSSCSLPRQSDDSSSLLVLLFCSIIRMQQMYWRQQKFPVKCGTSSVCACAYHFSLFLWMWLVLFSSFTSRVAEKVELGGNGAEEWVVGHEWVVKCRWLAARNQSKTVASTKEKEAKKKITKGSAHAMLINLCVIRRVSLHAPVALCEWVWYVCVSV